MLGAIIGDIVGSIYEWDNIKTKDFPLFSPECFFTDDSVMTIAVADAIMKGGTEDDFIDSMKKWGRMYPGAGYGGNFANWLRTDDREPYNSWGNGSAMRVSPCAWASPMTQLSNQCLDDVKVLAERSAHVTHNHPEGIKGAVETAQAILIMLRARLEDDYPENISSWKEKIREASEYNLNFTLDEIRPGYGFDVSCMGSVPQAIVAFLESTDFEDAIRNAISIGGDSDTVAAITGGIAEAAYGIPKDIEEKALTYLTAPMRECYHNWVLYLEGINNGNNETRILRILQGDSSNT